MAEDFVYIDATGRAAPNGKPIGKDGNGLPYGWEETMTPEGVTYYLDHNTRTTAWTCPEPHTGKDTVEPITRPTPLPAGWEQRLAQNGRRYYVDHNTRTTSWVRPLEDVEETTRPLPQGWERRRRGDGSARLYFVNHNDKTTTWDYPEHITHGSKQIAGTCPSTPPKDPADLVQDKD